MPSQIVIIGSGIGAIHTIQYLKSLFKSLQVEITMITKQDSIYFNLASIKGIIDSQFHSKLFIPYTQLSTHLTVIHDTVISVNPNEKFIKTNHHFIHYDMLVIASGCAYPSPLKLHLNQHAGMDVLHQITTAIKLANSIIIVGGGPSGIELCHEIATDYPDKHITLIHSGSQLVPGPYKPQFHHKLRANLHKKQVNVILNQRVTNLRHHIPNPMDKGWQTGDLQIKTSQNTYNCDLLMDCTGNLHPNSQFMPINTLDSNGYIQTRHTCQLQLYDDIFAIGDVSNLSPFKMAYIAIQHAKLVSHNIQSHLQSKSMKLIHSNHPIIISIKQGHSNRIHGNCTLVSTPYVYVHRLFHPLLKSMDQLTTDYWKLLNAKYSKNKPDSIQSPQMNMKNDHLDIITPPIQTMEPSISVNAKMLTINE
eukprot:NODE_395_length_8134_cov_0.767393.p1 type:complete len:420 gc:universal NODE_395_length_8134_cov_0.767393:6194-4935(-)